MHNLTNHTEKNKLSFTHTQREHRKGKNRIFISLILHIDKSAIAPFINQLRELHHLFDDIQKKIQKRLSILKIKTNEQTEFLQTISIILHGDEKLHLTINTLNEKEFHIEIQDKEIEHLSSILFRYQYSTPCLESNQTKFNPYNETNLTRSTMPFASIKFSTR